MNRLFVALRLELQRRTIYAVALASGSGTVGENMAEVGATLAADDLFADHAVALIHLGVHDLIGGGGGEAGPAAAAVKLFRRAKQFGPAANAAVFAVFVVIPVLTGKGWLGSFFTGYVELIGRQLLAPLIVGFLDVVRHG